jgi:hypothetical protein
MPTEQQLIESIRSIVADGDDGFGRDIDIAAGVLDGVRARRRRRAIAGTAVAVAVVSVASYVGIHAVTSTTAIPPTTQTSDAPVGHTVLPPEILNLRGKDVGDALGLAPSTGSAGDCAGSLAAYAPGQGFCVDLGNAPDNWLVASLIADASRASGPLRSLGIPWDSDLPAPPPVVVGFVEVKVAAIKDSSGADSAAFHRAQVNLDFARALWTDKAGWESVGWNDQYWGDPWWPTPLSSGQEPGHSVIPPEMLSMRGAELGFALKLPVVLPDPETGEYADCPPTASPGDGTLVEFGDGHRAFCIDIGNAPDDWLATYLVFDHPSPDEGMLTSTGVEWTASLPPPPPVAIELLRARIATLEAQQAEDTSDWAFATTFLGDMQARWADDRADWEVAGWNDTYWGDPWWPTDQSL